MAEEKYIDVFESEAETYESDDSQSDPSFDIVEEFSSLSIKKKSRSRIHKETSKEPADDDPDVIEMAVPLDAKDQKNLENIQKIIEAGQVEKLKVDECKLYLRKHRLRLTGKKDVLIQRIKEHLSIRNGDGEKKYPASSFVMNCKGDACTGDVVMFEQNVYEMFSIASRSATGPPCGKRIVAGRIVNESYGAAKQQHTFTIEVLWSKGVKPLPPLHPLLIKGRNLYRLKTTRQRWEDEGLRQKMLLEKHARGAAARSNREARLQEKEMKKTLRESRILRKNTQNEKQEEKKKKASKNPKWQLGEEHQQNISNASMSSQGVLGIRPPMMMHYHHRAPYTENFNSINILGGAARGKPNGQRVFSSPPYKENVNSINNILGGPDRGELNGHFRADFHGFHGSNTKEVMLPRFHFQGRRPELCRYYAQGRCHFGTNCKYLH